MVFTFLKYIPYFQHSQNQMLLFRGFATGLLEEMVSRWRGGSTDLHPCIAERVAILSTPDITVKRSQHEHQPCIVNEYMRNVLEEVTAKIVTCRTITSEYPCASASLTVTSSRTSLVQGCNGKP